MVKDIAFSNIFYIVIAFRLLLISSAVAQKPELSVQIGHTEDIQSVAL